MKSKLFASFIILYAKLFIMCYCEILSSKERLEKFIGKVSDPKFDCNPHTLSPKSRDKIDSEKLIEVVSCDVDGARFDYLYQPGDGKKPKRGPFNGFGSVSFAKHSENGKFNHGFKLGKCFILNDKTISKIIGTFKNDNLQGHVRIQFIDDTYRIGHILDGVLSGIHRHFTNENLLVNISNFDTGHTYWQMNTFGYQKIFDKEMDKVFISYDFSSDMRICREISDSLFKDCINIDEFPKLETESCEVILANARVSADDAKLHKLSLYHDQIRDQADQAVPCNSTNGASWNTKDIRGSIEDWIKSLGTPHLLWHLDSDEQPLDPENPEVDIFLSHYKTRKGFENLFVKILSDNGLELFKGHMKEGRIRGKVDPEIAKHPGWRTRLNILLSSDKASSENRVIHVEKNLDQYSHAVVGNLKHGKLHGIVQMFGVVSNDQNGHCAGQVWSGVSFIGRFENGKAVGQAWRGLVGGSWIVGQVDRNGDFSGEGNIAYIYNDIETAFTGTFKNGIMIKGREATVIGEKCDEHGIKTLRFSEPTGPVFHYEEPNHVSFGDQPHLQDPLDKKYIALRNSELYPMAGEATFATRDVPAYTVFVLYGGMLLTNDQFQDFREEQEKQFKDRKWHRDNPEATALWMYRHSLGKCDMKIEIPPEFGPTSKYQGTLGHKVNHVFEPNSKYIQVDSARFGIVNAVMTNQDIKKDQEYFASYGYNVRDGPKWYRDLFRVYALKNPDKVKKATLAELEEFETKITQDLPENQFFNSNVGQLDSQKPGDDDVESNSPPPK